MENDEMKNNFDDSTKDGSKDIGDIEIEDKKEDKKDDDKEVEKKEETTTKNDDSTKDDIATLKKQIEDLEKDKEIRENEIAVNNALSELSSKHTGFDAEKVKSYLVELNKTDEQKAQMLNNPLGWENIWLNEFATKEVENDNPSFGRNIKTVDRSEEIEEKIKNGERISTDDEQNYYGNLL